MIIVLTGKQLFTSLTMCNIWSVDLLYAFLEVECGKLLNFIDEISALVAYQACSNCQW